MTMVDPSSEDDGTLREWSPLSTLASQIPLKAQRGLFTGDLNLTCIAALPDYLAIGTNHGLVYWYNRTSNELQRLRCENTACAITCVAVTSTVDYMVAAGTSTGTVNVFLIPKASPDNIPEIFKTNFNKQIERYTVGELHSASISAIEWSLNGMKLFSGDQNGVIVLTEMDFYMHLCKSVEILNEKYEVVQLNYNSSNQLLLVSTMYRTILCHRSHTDGVWKVSQVGNKERKILGRMGAIFYHNPQNPRSPKVYCSRPGLRMWIANKDGVVEKTLMFKDSVLGQHPLIQLLNPTKSRSRQSRGEPQLGPLLTFKDDLLVTYSAEALLILDPLSISVVAALYDVQRVTALCVTKSEIFLLEGERHLIRLGFHPEDIKPTSISDNGASALSGNIANQFLELTAKIKETSIKSIIPMTKNHPIFSSTKSSGSSDGEQVSECVEAQELPPIVALDSLSPGTSAKLPTLQVDSTQSILCTSDCMSEKEVLTRAQRSSGTFQSNSLLRSEILDQISQEQFEEIVFQPKKKTKKNKKQRSVLTTGFESGSDTTSVMSTTSENDETWSNERLDGSSEWSNVSMNTSRRSSFDTQLKPEVLSFKPTTSIGKENDVSRGKLLGEALASDKFTRQTAPESVISSSIPKPEAFASTTSLNLGLLSEDEIEEILATKERLLARKYNLEAELRIKEENEDGVSDSVDIRSKDERFHECALDTNRLYVQKGKNLDALHSMNEPDTSEVSKCLQDDVTILNELDASKISRDRQENVTISENQSADDMFEGACFTNEPSLVDLNFSGAKEENRRSKDCKEAMEASGWLQFSAPKPAIWIAVSNHYLVAIDTNNTVHYSVLGGLGLKWQKADCKASQIALSPNLSCVWRLHNNVAYALRSPAFSGPHGDEWVEAASNVCSIAAGEDSVWLVSQDGDIFCQKGLSKDVCSTDPLKVEKPCEWPAVKIVCFSQLVWLLSSMGEVYVRLGVSSARPEGIEWRRVNIPVPGSVVDISLGLQRTGWIVDKDNNIMFSVDHMEREPHWWQVLISDYVFQQTSPLQRLRSTLKNLRPPILMPLSHMSCVVSSKESIWILQHKSKILHANKTKITGHAWTRVRLKGCPTGIKWQTVTAEGVFESGGQIWLLSANGDLFCTQPYNNRKIEQIPLPSSDGAVCLAASSQSLWVLTSTGKIYTRHGVSEKCLEGESWTQLSLMQIEDVHLTHVSCGLDVIWACDTAGHMHMTVSFPHAVATNTFSPVWIRVPENKSVFFIKVFVGPQTYMVWALDNQGKVYVREAIFPDFPLGADWVAVTGISAVDLSVSSTAVWALSVDGDIYTRQGITQNNYIGDYWKKIPGSVEALTASMCDRLWGIDTSGSLLRHTQLAVNLNPNSGTPITSQPVDFFSTGVEGDWEVL